MLQISTFLILYSKKCTPNQPTIYKSPMPPFPAVSSSSMPTPSSCCWGNTTCRSIPLSKKQTLPALVGSFNSQFKFCRKFQIGNHIFCIVAILIVIIELCLLSRCIANSNTVTMNVQDISISGMLYKNIVYGGIMLLTVLMLSYSTPFTELLTAAIELPKWALSRKHCELISDSF